MNEPINFALKKVEKTGDCRDWTVLDALKDTISQIEKGEIRPDMVYIAMRDRDKAGDIGFIATKAGGTFIEIAGLLTMHVQVHLNDDE